MGGWNTPGQSSEIWIALGRKKGWKENVPRGMAQQRGLSSKRWREAAGLLTPPWNFAAPPPTRGCPLPLHPSGPLLSHLHSRCLDWVRGVEGSDLSGLCGKYGVHVLWASVCMSREKHKYKTGSKGM